MKTLWVIEENVGSSDGLYSKWIILDCFISKHKALERLTELQEKNPSFANSYRLSIQGLKE